MTTSGPDAPRQPVGHPGPRWEAGDTINAADAPAPPASPLPSGPDRGEPPGRTPTSPTAPQPASYLRRSGAWLIDEVSRTLFYGVILIAFASVGGALPEPVSPGEISSTALLPQIVLRIGLSWIFWTQGTSPGAALLGLRIVDARGEAPGARRALVRAVMEVLSIMLLMLGFVWALLTRRRQTWQDVAAGTYIVVVDEERDRSR